jgi:hypothetical protein
MLVIGSMVLLVIGKFLASVARNIVKRGKSEEEHNGGFLSYVKLLFALPFVLWFIAFFLAAMISFVWWPFIFFRYVWRHFGSIWAIALAVLLVTLNVIMQTLWWRNQKVKKWQDAKLAALMKRNLETHDDPFARPFQGTFAALMFGGWHLFLGFTLQKVLQEFSIERGFFTTNLLLLTSALWGLVIGAIFYVGFSLRAFASKRNKIRRLAWLEIGAYTFLAYSALVVIYSTSVYWRMPPFLGGGQPPPVSVWFDGSGSQLDLNRQLPQAKCMRSEEGWMCSSAYLVDASGDSLILVDGESPTSNSLVVPKSKVLALASGTIRNDGTREAP